MLSPKLTIVLLYLRSYVQCPTLPCHFRVLENVLALECMTVEQRAKYLWLVSHTPQSEAYWKQNKTFGASRQPKAAGMAEKWCLLRLFSTTSL